MRKADKTGSAKKTGRSESRWRFQVASEVDPDCYWGRCRGPELAFRYFFFSFGSNPSTLTMSPVS